MKSVHLLTMAFGLAACTHTQSTTIVCTDSLLSTHLSKVVTAAPVVNNRPPVVKAALKLPFFKDVLDSKRLFW